MDSRLVTFFRAREHRALHVRVAGTTSRRKGEITRPHPGASQ